MFDSPSDAVLLKHFLISFSLINWGSSGRRIRVLGIFQQEGGHCGVFFPRESRANYMAGISGENFLIIRERRSDLLRPIELVESYVLDLLMGSSLD